MKRAWLNIRMSPNYRRAAFEEGLRACGYTIMEGEYPTDCGPGDLYLTWNRYGMGDDGARRMEKFGGTVVVAENGYVGVDENGVQLYALARGQHNGAGTWIVGKEDRWSRLGIELKPWKTGGSYVLLLPQRGIGPKGVAMPHDWLERTVKALRAEGFATRTRLHPGTNPPPTTLEDDLAGASCAVTWGSGAAVKALVAGVPVFAQFDKWICADAAARLCEFPTMQFCDRRPVFHNLSYAQWTVAEITAGTAFKVLLDA